MGLRFRQWPIVLAAAVLSHSGVAGTLQVSPIVLELQAGESAAGMTLRNPDMRPLYRQVRVFRWDQVDGEDRFASTPELVASPPLVELGPQSTQVVRTVPKW